MQHSADTDKETLSKPSHRGSPMRKEENTMRLGGEARHVA